MPCCCLIHSLSDSPYPTHLEQETDFGGWPEKLEEIPVKSLSAEHICVLRKHCSQNPSVSMPNLPVTVAGLMSPVPTAPKKSSSNVVTPPIVTELDPNNMPKKPTSKVALDMHKRWQQQAEKMGGREARIVVEKSKAKKIIFDLLHDAFAPMNITQIHSVRRLLCELKSRTFQVILETHLCWTGSESCGSFASS